MWLFGQQTLYLCQIPSFIFAVQCWLHELSPREEVLSRIGSTPGWQQMRGSGRSWLTPLPALGSVRECVCVGLGFIRGLLSADAVTCCEAGVSEACHTSQRFHRFKDTLGVLGHLLLSDNISPQQNKGWLFVFTKIMFWMWGGNAVLYRMKVSLCMEKPGCYILLLQPFIFLFWLMKRFNWTMLRACKMLFVYPAASEQTNKQTRANQRTWQSKTQIYFAQPFHTYYWLTEVFWFINLLDL